MTVRAVRAQAASFLANVSVENTPWDHFNSYPYFPKLDDQGSACMSVVGEMKAQERRLHGPRVQGKKQIPYQIDFLVQARADDPQRGGEGFDVLVENVLSVLRHAVPGSATLVDNKQAPSVTSYMTHIGENINFQILTPEVADISTVMTFRAVVTVEVIEVIIG